MKRSHWKPVALSVCGVVAAVLAASASAPAASPAGPCLPSGIPQPPGVPHLPTCQKEGSASNLRLKVDGSVTAAYALHSEYWGQCNAAHGGGSHTDASAEINFGTPVAASATARYRADAAAKTRVLTVLDATPTVQATVNPKQDQRHEVAPGCGVVKDPTSCTQSKGEGEVTVHLSNLSDLARVTVRPPGFLVAQCNAPFVGTSAFDDLAFQHELDNEDEALLAHVANPASKIKTGTISWDESEKPCSAYGFKQPTLFGGAFEKCTVKANFRIVITRVASAH